jgi:hypothetical protein
MARDKEGVYTAFVTGYADEMSPFRLGCLFMFIFMVIMNYDRTAAPRSRQYASYPRLASHSGNERGVDGK